MADVSEQELAVIKANPSGAGLDAFRMSRLLLEGLP